MFSDPDVGALERAIAAAVDGGSMPAASLTLYARWWQLETWLRDLTYLELRALRGKSWADAVKAARGRQSDDALFTHMLGADIDNPLAYLDFSQLLDVIERHWAQTSSALLPSDSWRGAQADLKQIRHRIGHVRRPHADDVGRLEQVLRDLERGAFIAYASYNDRRGLAELAELGAGGPVVNGWLHRQHETARRLIDHAQREYETRLRVELSRRPWTSWNEVATPGGGFLWHADFRMRERTVDVRDLWHDSTLDEIRPLLVHLRADSPWHVGFTFSAADEAAAVSDAIGRAFDLVLETGRPDFISEEAERRWRQRAAHLDYRVHVQSGWNNVHQATLPMDIFGAGGSTESSPRW